MSHELTKNQKNRHFEVLSSLVLCNSKEPFLNRMVTCDESGFCTMTNNGHLRDWTKKRLQSTSWSQTCTKKKIIITVCWSAAGLIHYNFLNPGKTITSEKYAQQISETPGKLQRLRLALVNRKGPILPHDNVWPHVARPTLQKLNKLGYKILLHPPYSPDFSPTN